MDEGFGFNEPFDEDEGDLGSQIGRFEEMLNNNQSYFFDVDVFESIIDHYLEKNDFRNAMKAISIANSQHPDSVPLLIRKAEIHASSGKLNKALEILQRVENLEPSNEDIYVLKAGIFSQLHNHEEAIRNIRKAIRLAEDEGVDELYVDLAFEYESIQEWNKAIDSLEKALLINPENESALFELTYCFEMSGQSDKGISFLNQFLDFNPYSYIAWYSLGNAYVRKGMYNNAVEAFDFATTINESFSSAWFNKGNAYVHLEQFKHAILSYQQTFQYEDPQAITYCYIGECFEKLEQPEEAYQNFQKATELDPELEEGWVGLAIAANNMNRTVEAISHIERALSYDKSVGENWFIYAEILDKAGRTDDAKAAYINALDNDPENLEMILDYTHFLLEKVSKEEAISELEEMIDRQGSKPEFLYRLAAYHYLNGKKEMALDFLAAALESDLGGLQKLFEYLPELKDDQRIIELVDQYQNKA